MSSSPAAKPPSLRSQLSQAPDAAQIAGLFIAERERLREANLRQPQGMRACRSLTDLTDLAIQRLLALALPADDAARDAVRQKIAVVATGGYGRRELCPHSDIDVTFIVAEEEDPDLDQVVRGMFLCLMELFSQRCGLKVGYAYRTLQDVPHLDHQTQTALLDTRVVAGSNALAQRFLQEFFRQLWPAAFVRQKVAERREMIARQGGTPYRIETEVREGPGGLRDMQLAEWLSAVSYPSTRGDVWSQLLRLGAVSRRDAQEVAEAREFLLTVRNWMHWETGRHADLVVRERQEGLAVALGFQDDPEASRVERLMEAYYRHTEHVQRVSGFVVERCLLERLSLSDELACAGNELLPAYPWLKVSSPRFLLEVCRHYREHGLGPGHELRRMIAEHIDGCPDLATKPDAADLFVNLLRAATGSIVAPATVPPPAGSAYPSLTAATWGGIGRQRPGVYETFALMADLGVLQRLVPELGAAYRRVPFDQVHRHTIGYHSLETVRSLERLRATTEDKLQSFRTVWSEIDAPELLFLAALLHDVGKLAAVGGHSTQGAAMARDICKRLRLDAEQTETVATLVQHHLLLSETAQLRDITLDKTMEDFLSVVNTRALLNMLLLLTYADMEATGVLSPVKVRLLEELYFRAEPVLDTGSPFSPAEEPEDRARRYRTRLSRRLSGANLTPEQIKEHTEGMPVSYLLNTRSEQIATHIRMVEALRTSDPPLPVVEFENDLDADLTLIHLCSWEDSRPGLLSQIAGVLYAHEVSVHVAQVFTRAGRPAIALDTLLVDFHGRSVPGFKRIELEQDLVRALARHDAEGVIARCRKPMPRDPAPRKIRVDNESAESATVVEIEAEDQPGLLYRLTKAISGLGWNIHSARISTRGDRARDAFYVTDRDGHKLQGTEAEVADAFTAELRGDPAA